MARPTNRSSPHGGDNEDDEEVSTRITRRRSSPAPSPALSVSSDKENRVVPRNADRDLNGKSMPPPNLPTPTSSDTANRTNKRRRLGERNAPNGSQTAYQAGSDASDATDDTRFYDPDQPMEERRAVRKGIRDLARDLTDSRNEYLQADSTGLIDTITKANDLYRGVKQTSDATLDSRLLVTTGDLSYRRSAQMKLGTASQGVDLDEFVSKCLSFMRNGPSDIEAAASSAVSTRRRQRRDDSDEGSGAETGDDGDACNWEWLGRKVCFSNNIRPPVPGFLLGPLSVQKRMRKVTQRRERLQKRDPRDAVRPEELKTKDLEQAENTNLTEVCKNIYELLLKTRGESMEKAQEEFTETMSAREADDLMLKYGLTADGISLFHFAINPTSFGQTVENLFYLSFLIRDGYLGITQDKNLLPSLELTTPSTAQEIKEQNLSKRQAIFHLDYDVWESLVQSYNLNSCIIPHRRNDESIQVGTRGWYS